MYDVDYVKTRTNRVLGIFAIHSSPVQVAILLYDEKQSTGLQETQQAMQRGRSREGHGPDRFL